MKQLVISFLSPDRRGLVEQISQIIKQHQGNWQVSSMHHLSGFFAGVIQVQVAEAELNALQTAIEQIENFKVNIAIAEAVQEEKPSLVVFELTANDRPGIIQDISSVIHREAGNLIKLVSVQENAAHTGQVLFKAKASIEISKDDQNKLIAALENIADDLMVDILC